MIDWLIDITLGSLLVFASLVLFIGIFVLGVLAVDLVLEVFRGGK